MFGAMPTGFVRKPREKWFFYDNGITGILASQHYEQGPDGIILPHGLSEEQRDLVLWAYETAYLHGKYAGERGLRIEFKRLMNLDGFA